MKHLLWIAMCLAVVPAAEAAPWCAAAAGLPQIAETGQAAPPLVVALPEELADGGEVHAAYRVAGETVFAERVVVGKEGTGAGPAVFELLAWHPGQLDALLAAGGAVEVELTLPSRTEVHGLAALRSESARLLAEKVAPRPVRSTVLASTAPAPRLEKVSAADITQEQCLDICLQENLWCEDSCGWGDESCYQRCHDEYLDCKEHCYACPEVTETTTTAFTGHTYAGPSRCLSHNFYGNTYYDRMQRTFKHTTTRYTWGCDGSYTSEVVAVWYTTDYCYRYTSVPCSSPFGPASLYCTYYY